MNKEGLSGIVAVSIILMLSIVGIAGIWGLTNKFLNKESTGINTGSDALISEKTNKNLLEKNKGPCANLKKDPDETGIDCGGSCPACAPAPPQLTITLLTPSPTQTTFVDTSTATKGTVTFSASNSNAGVQKVEFVDKTCASSSSCTPFCAVNTKGTDEKWTCVWTPSVPSGDETVEYKAKAKGLGSSNQIAISNEEARIEVHKSSCSDEIKNQGEEGIDCGGPCSACYVAPVTVTLNSPSTDSVINYPTKVHLAAIVSTQPGVTIDSVEFYSNLPLKAENRIVSLPVTGSGTYSYDWAPADSGEYTIYAYVKVLQNTGHYTSEQSYIKYRIDRSLYPCTDNDGGDQPLIFGTMVFVQGDGSKVIREDLCGADSSSGKYTHFEYYCFSNRNSYSMYDCSSCNNNACNNPVLTYRQN